jgi:hypothetical protein
MHARKVLLGRVMEVLGKGGGIVGERDQQKKVSVKFVFLLGLMDRSCVIHTKMLHLCGCLGMPPVQ